MILSAKVVFSYILINEEQTFPKYSYEDHLFILSDYIFFISSKNLVMSFFLSLWRWHSPPDLFYFPLIKISSLWSSFSAESRGFFFDHVINPRLVSKDILSYMISFFSEVLLYWFEKCLNLSEGLLTLSNSF